MGGRTAGMAAVAVWAGLALGATAAPVAAWGAGALALAFLALARRAPDRVGTVAVVLALGSAAIARGAAGRAALEAASRDLRDDRPAAWLSARVVDHPWIEAGEPLVLVESRRAGAALPSGARVRMRLPEGSAVEWGDTLMALARIEPPRRARVPGGGSARDAAWAQGFVGHGRGLWVEHGAPVGGLARATVTRWRRAIESRFARELSPATREIVAPLVVGDRSALGAELDARLRASGLTHLIALSGLHVAWMAAVARGLAAAAGAGPAARAGAGALCALFYLGVAGPLPSLARAAVSEIFVALAGWRGRAIDSLQALALSAALLLAWAPGWAGDLGFQLSCAATLGLVTLGRAGDQRLRSLPPVAAAMLAPMMLTGAAQVTALPIALARFHALPWTGIGANLLGVPVCELLLSAAWLGVLLDALAPGAGRWCFAACEVLAGALRSIADLASAAPLALLPTGASPWPAGLAAAGAALAVIATLGPRDLAHRLIDRSRGRIACRWLGALAVALALLLGATAPTLLAPAGRWWWVTLDVGQGDALALGTPQGWWLIDTGPRTPAGDAGERVVLPFLRWAAVRRLDGLVLTHDHGDHVGGAAAVLRGVTVSRVVVPAGPAPPRAAPGAALRARAGDTLLRAPRVVVRWPEVGFHARDPNASSLVLEVGEGASRVLLAADVDSAVEARLAPLGKLGGLKVAHHGAAASSGAAFLAATRPRWAVVSCGRHNPFGHPDAGALARLAAAGARVRRTDRDGTLWLELSAEGVRELAWRNGREPREAIAPPPARGASGPLAGAPARW